GTAAILAVVTFGATLCVQPTMKPSAAMGTARARLICPSLLGCPDPSGRAQVARAKLGRAGHAPITRVGRRVTYDSVPEETAAWNWARARRRGSSSGGSARTAAPSAR